MGRKRFFEICGHSHSQLLNFRKSIQRRFYVINQPHEVAGKLSRGYIYRQSIEQRRILLNRLKNLIRSALEHALESRFNRGFG